MHRRSQSEQQERFRKRLVWLDTVTLAGVLMLLGAAVFPETLGLLRRIGVVATLFGGVAQICSSVAYMRSRR
jgi:uncharacterized membrane protein